MSEEKKETPVFNTRVEGKKALDALFENLETEGLLVEPEQEVSNVLSRLSTLEKEVDLLKDLLARALNVKKDNVLKG